MTVNFTIELSESQKIRLEELAEYHGVSVTKLVIESAERILEEDAAFVAAVQEGIAAADRGDLIDHEDVVREAAERRERLLAQPRS
ncbi:MAG: CopG family ribbon-helix-helix protein [Ignavibacteriales bacterium]